MAKLLIEIDLEDGYLDDKFKVRLNADVDLKRCPCLIRDNMTFEPCGSVRVTE
jgi:hypothetical protein